MIEEYNLLIASVGGQGGITLARIISNAALNQGLNVRVGETLGMAQRGGSVQSHVRFGEDVHGPLIPERGSNVLLSLEPAEALRVAKYIGRKTTVIMNTHPVLPPSVLLNETTYPEIDQILSILRKIGGSVHALNALDLAKKAGFSRSLNIVMLGAYVTLGGQILSLESIKKTMASFLPSRYMEQNVRALEMGIEKMRESI